MSGLIKIGKKNCMKLKLGKISQHVQNFVIEKLHKQHSNSNGNFWLP